MRSFQGRYEIDGYLISEKEMNRLDGKGRPRAWNACIPPNQHAFHMNEECDISLILPADENPSLTNIGLVQRA